MSLRVSDYVCANCNIEFRGRGGARRKLCGVCQAHRDITYLGDRPKVCEMCDKVFFPWRTNYKVCYECSDPKHGLEQFYPEACKGCGEHNRIAPGLEHHCCSCVQKDAQARKGYLRRLTALIRERLTGNPTTPEATS